MSKWHEVAVLEDFRKRKRVECQGKEIALFRLEDGVYALDDICSHEFSRLSEGEIWDNDVYCEKHGSRFDIKSGAVKSLPATRAVNSYPTRIEDGKVYVKC